MPQATPELRARWEDDSAAWAQLSPNFFDANGMIRPRFTPTTIYKPTADDYSAIDYLCQEWDYGYEG